MSEDNTSSEKLYTLKEVADRFRVSERTIHNLLHSGNLEGMLIARRWKFTEKMVEDFEHAQLRKEGKGAKKKRAYVRRATTEAS